MAHTSGEWTQCTVLLPATEKRKEYKKDGSFEWVNQFTAQTCGIAMTYSRRYSYQAVICVAAEVDDDANAISVHDQGSTETQKAVADRKIKEIAAKMGKKIEPKEADGNRAVFILEWPEDKEGDVLITGPANVITDLGAIRKPNVVNEGQENHRLIKYSLITKFYDLAAGKGIIVKDLAEKAAANEG